MDEFIECPRIAEIGTVSLAECLAHFAFRNDSAQITAGDVERHVLRVIEVPTTVDVLDDVCARQDAALMCAQIFNKFDHKFQSTKSPSF